MPQVGRVNENENEAHNQGGKMGIFGLLLIALLFLIPYLYVTNHVFRFYVKFISYFGICILTGLWVAPYAFIRNPMKPKDCDNLK